MRISRAPGRLDVMGGITDYTGSLVCEMPLDRAAAVAVQPRDDRQVQVVSFNLLGEHRPFTLRVPLDALANQPTESLQREFNKPGRKWAGYLTGCLHILHQQGLVNLLDHSVKGFNIAVLSTVPLGAGVSSSAAIEVAMMMNLLGQFDLTGRVEPLDVAAMCQRVENHVVGAPCGIMDQVASLLGQESALLRLLCQPHELQEPLAVPAGMCFVGINSNVKHSVGGSAYTKTRCAAFMAHKMIFEAMRAIGQAAGRELLADPMNGYLANLDPEDYKRLFRPSLPEFIKGGEFLMQYGGTIDRATRVQADMLYPVQHAADHHVLEARRVTNFVKFLQQAAHERDPKERGLLLDRAGHLMYASHLSYTNDAMLGAPECDLLVDLVRKRERKGLYGAKITGGGSGGTVAVLLEDSQGAWSAVDELMAEYQRQTGNTPELFRGTSLGAWAFGSFIT